MDTPEPIRKQWVTLALYLDMCQPAPGGLTITSMVEAPGSPFAEAGRATLARTIEGLEEDGVVMRRPNRARATFLTSDGFEVAHYLLNAYRHDLHDGPYPPLNLEPHLWEEARLSA